MTDKVALRWAWTQREQRAIGWDVMRVRGAGLEDWWCASVDLWWFCARLEYRCETPARTAA